MVSVWSKTLPPVSEVKAGQEKRVWGVWGEGEQLQCSLFQLEIEILDSTWAAPGMRGSERRLLQILSPV